MQIEGLEFEGRAPLRPGPRSLRVEDLGVYEAHGGHTLRRHVDTEPGDELRRIQRENVAAAGSFLDRRTAQRCVDVALTRHRREVLAWLSGPDRRAPFMLQQDMGEVVGRSLTSADVRRGVMTPRPVTAVRLVLRRHADLPGGFTVVTAYPARARREARPR